MLIIKNFIVLYHTAGYEDFVFLILVILATAAQAYSQYRKREMAKKRGAGLDEEDTTTIEEEESYSPVFRKFREVMGDEFFDEEKVEIVHPPVIEKKQPELSKEQGRAVFSNNNKFETERLKHRNGIAKEKKEVTGNKSFKKQIKKNFDLKKAVIYSEILNRKYFF
jgi:hypothetical protein